MVWMGVESRNEPAARLLRLKRGVSDEGAVTPKGHGFRRPQRLFDGQPVNIGIKRVPGELRMFAQGQQIEVEDFFCCGHVSEG